MVLLFIGCIQSCSTEESLLENDSQIKTVTKEEALLFLKQNPINTSTKFLKKESFTLNFNAITQEKITNSDQLITIIPIDNKEKKEYERILFLKIKDTIKSAVFSMYPDENSSSKNFSGKIKITSLNGHFINGFRIKNGHFISRFLKKEPTNYKNKEFSKLIVIDGVEFEELDEVIIINNYRSSPSTIYYMTLFEEWSNYGGNNNDYGMGWNYGGGSGSGENAETDEEIARKISDSIDVSQLDPCTKEVFEKLKTLTNSDISSIFEKFGVPVNGTYNIKIVLGTPQKPTALADTKSAGKNNYIITIRDTYIKGTENNGKPPTDLSIATVIIHELIHAHFFALFDDYHNNGDICAYDNFACLYEKYVTKTFGGNDDAQHAQMFDNYIPIMASTLAQFKPGQPFQFYEDLAISTMYGLDFYNAKYPKGGDERTRIENNRLSEDYNRPFGEAIPKGVPCSIK